MIPILINTNVELIENSGIRILFDGSDIDTDYVMGLSQNVEMFNKQFKLGSTLCRTMSLQIDKGGVSSHPSLITILNKDNELIYTLLVDEIDESNDFYYTYNLTDVMVRMNVEFEYDKDAGLSVMDLLELICSNHDIELVNDSLYLSDMVISWTQSGMSERDFISYVAEVNGGYAYINKEGNLVFAKFNNTSKGTIDSDKCSSIKIGDKHLIDRVFVELASASYGVPEQETNNETLYINSNNYLLSDSGNYTIEGILNHIYNDINGFTFYNVIVEKCPIVDCKCGEIISFKVDNVLYPTIAQIDYNYSSGWIGGYTLQLENSTQAETQIKSGVEKAKNEITIIVNRELGTITQRVESVEESVESIEGDVEEIGEAIVELDTKVDGLDNTGEIRTIVQSVSSLQQDSSSIKLSVAKVETQIDDAEKKIASMQTSLSVESDGVHITQGTEGSYVLITDKGMEIYAEGNKVAYALSDGFYSSDYITNGWHMQTTNNNNSFNFIRKDYGDE